MLKSHRRIECETADHHDGMDPTPAEPAFAGIEPVFLPVVAVPGLSTLYFEALARVDANAGHIPLIARAEAGGYVGKIDIAVLKRVVELLRASPAAVVGVNVSAGTLKFDAENWLNVLAEAEDVADRLVVEFTESQSFDDRETLAWFVFACREFGVRFALDDFEAGRFDDELVSAASPEIIKLADIWEGGVEKARSRLVHFLDEASRHGASVVVAEWVDSGWKQDLVAEVGISHAQGLFVGGHRSFDAVVRQTGPGERRLLSVAT